MLLKCRLVVSDLDDGMPFTLCGMPACQKQTSFCGSTLQVAVKLAADAGQSVLQMTETCTVSQRELCRQNFKQLTDIKRPAGDVASVNIGHTATMIAS